MTDPVSGIHFPKSPMHFNPNISLDDSLLNAGQMRDQFNGLDSKIDNIPAGPPGPQGEPGEVSLAQLTAAIDGTAQNPASVGPFTGSFSNPPTQPQMQAFAFYLETLRMALVRS